MTTLWMKDGFLVVDENGLPVMCEECPCEEEGETFECCFDDPVSACLSATIAGLTNGTCENCDDANGVMTFNIPDPGIGDCAAIFTRSVVGDTNCSWLNQAELSITAISGTECMVTVFIDCGDDSCGSAATYQATFLKSYDVSTGFVLDYLGGDGICNDWPATITLMPS